MTAFPFLTSYDPPGTSEGSLDPLGLYQVSDQLAVQLVPAVRERMQRIRFLTAMAVGARVTEGLDDNPRYRDASPYLIWEWLIVEALIRTRNDESTLWGVPGTLVTQRALDQYGYLDARSYLKTPRIFGFHGVYKRLAMHLGIVDVHLGVGPNTNALVDAWAKDLGLGGLAGAKATLARWGGAVRRCLHESPPRAKPGWTSESWSDLASAFSPDGAKAREKRFLRDLLNAQGDRRLGALPTIWQLQAESGDGRESGEERLHDQLEKREPRYRALLQGIRSYERFARGAQDAFDLLKAEASSRDANGYLVTDISRDGDFRKSVKDLNKRFEAAHRALGEVAVTSLSLQNLFGERFAAFGEPLDPGVCALALCRHHEGIQRRKSADGKRPWFDRLGHDRIRIRPQYRERRRETMPGRYVHPYRGEPIGRFHGDLS